MGELPWFFWGNLKETPIFYGLFVCSKHRYFPVGFHIIHWISCGFKGVFTVVGDLYPLDGIGTLIHEVGCYWLGFLDGQCWLSEITSLFLVLVEFTVETITNRYNPQLLLFSAKAMAMALGHGLRAMIHREHGDFSHNGWSTGIYGGYGKNVSFSGQENPGDRIWDVKSALITGPYSLWAFLLAPVVI